jgi:hypothetical protein
LFDILVSGTYSLWQNAQGDSVGLVDGAFYRNVPPGEFGFPGVATTFNNGFILNGRPIASNVVPPGLSPTYEYRVPFIGLGQPVEVFIADHPPLSIDRHADNSGMLRVELYNVSPEIAVDSALIDFGEVELGSYRDTLVAIENVGYGPLWMHGLRIVGADATHFSGQFVTDTTLAPGERMLVRLRFEPGSIYLKQAALEFQCNDSDSPVVTIPLQGTGIITLTAGFAPLTRVPDQSVSPIPLLLERNRDGSNTTSYSLDVRYDRRLLLPRYVSTAGTLSEGFSADVQVLSPGLMRITATGSRPLTGTGVLLNVHCLAVYGTPPRTPLTIDTLVFNAGMPRALAVEGAVEIDSSCNQYLKSVTAIPPPRLHPNYPNPFNPETTVRFTAYAAEHVRIDVLTLQGRVLRTLLDRTVGAGEHRVMFTAEQLPSGVYLCRLSSARGVQLRRMTLLR